MAGLHFLKIIWKGRCKILIMCENSCKFRRLTVLFFGKWNFHVYSFHITMKTFFRLN
jgi:hypothetical protein